MTIEPETDAVLIEGIRVVLRDWRESDLAGWAYWLAPGQRWQELDGPYYPKPKAEDIPKLVERRRDTIVAGDLPLPRTSLVIALCEDDQLAGMVTWHWESKETWWAGIGISLFDPDHWGHGLGYEALGLWSQYLFDQLPQIVRLDMRTWSGNRGMMRLAEKLGYQLEARFRKARIVNGEYYDGLGYGILREEWDARYPGGFRAHRGQGL